MAKTRLTQDDKAVAVAASLFRPGATTAPPVEVVLERVIGLTNVFRVYRRNYLDLRNAFATIEATPGTDRYSITSGALSDAEALAVHYAVRGWYAPRKGVHYRELQLGDRVRLFDGDAGLGAPYNDATVINVTEKDVTFFRPYVHTSDFSHTGGITPYLGFEQFSVPRDHGTGTVALLYRETEGAIK